MRRIRERVAESQVFSLGHIRMTTSQLHTVKPLDVDIPRGRLVAVTGVSGSGKTTMVLESLIPALKAQAAGELLPEHVRELETEGIRRANLIDATPIARTCVLPWPLMPIFTTNCGAPLPDVRRLRRAAGRPAISHTIPADCVAYVRRHGIDFARRAVPAGCDHRMPGLLRLPVRARS